MSDHDLIIRQGKTFSQIIRWETTPIVYRAITGITQGAPVRITCDTTGLPDGWPVAIVSVKGMKQINTELDSKGQPKKLKYHQATVVDATHIDINDINSSEYTAYTSGGYVQFNTPHELTSYTARCSVKDKVSDTTANLWVASTVYAAGAYVVLADSTVLECSIGGTSGLNEPTAAGIDGTATWIATTSYAGSRELLRLTTENAKIVIDPALYTIKFILTAVETALLDWKRGVYELEMVGPPDGGGISEVTAILPEYPGPPDIITVLQETTT